jgi:hypothetical protein
LSNRSCAGDIASPSLINLVTSAKKNRFLLLFRSPWAGSLPTIEHILYLI